MVWSGRWLLRSPDSKGLRVGGLDRGGFFVKGGETSMNQDEMVTGTIMLVSRLN
jgi:hypothetical protein